MCLISFTFIYFLDILGFFGHGISTCLIVYACLLWIFIVIFSCQPGHAWQIKLDQQFWPYCPCGLFIYCCFLFWKWVCCWFMRTQIPLINYTSFLWNLHVLFFLPTSLCQVKWNYPENSGLDVLLDCNCFRVLRIGWAFHLWFIRAQFHSSIIPKLFHICFFKHMLYLMEN